MRNLLEDSVDGGEIQWAEAMAEPVDKLVVALNQYQIDDTFNDDNPRVWININDDSCINVIRIGSEYAYYSEAGSSDSHSMDIKYFAENYRLKGVGDKPAPVIDDTFNDDTPAQTFGDIKWDEGTQDRTEEIVVIPCPNCQRAVPYDKHGALFLVGKQAVCSDCYVKDGGENSNAGNKYTTRVPNLWRRDEKKVEAASKMRLIGIAGPARAGKDTLCSYMLDNLDGIWLRSSFADPLKEMLRAIGVDCSDEAKAVVSDDYGVTPRHMMQTLGTEWGRNLIDGDIWVKAFARLNAGKCVIVPDVRFENEANLVREHGVLIHLVGRGGIEGNHVSESAIEFKAGDIVIDNSRDLAWLHGQVDGNDALSDFIAEVSE